MNVVHRGDFFCVFLVECSRASLAPAALKRVAHIVVRYTMIQIQFIEWNRLW